MSMWLHNQSLSLAVLAAASLRVVQQGVSPATRRRVQTGFVRLVTAVAGH